MICYATPPKQEQEVLEMHVEPKSRKLKGVEFRLDLNEPEMWVLPFVGEALTLL